METRESEISVHFTGWQEPRSVPRWAQRFCASKGSLEALFDETVLPHVIVLVARRPAELDTHRPLLMALEERLKNEKSLTRLVFCPCSVLETLESITHVYLTYFSGIFEHVELAWDRENLEQSVKEAAAKYLVQRETIVRSFYKLPDTVTKSISDDPIGEARQVIEATRGLRSASGRLSADLVAKAFGLKQARLARILGRHRATVAKTPDAASLQAKLRPFERIARLRAVFSPESFLAWLNRANPHLDDLSPLEAIEAGHLEAVADFTENMLTGAPT